jgi:hypothetical protein
MVHAFLVLAAEHASTTSKTPFYICGGVFAVWAVVLAAIGLSQPEFPRDGTAARGVMAISAVLMLGAMTTAVVTA